MKDEKPALPLATPTVLQLRQDAHLILKNLAIGLFIPFAVMYSGKLIGFIAAIPSTLALVQRQYVRTVSGAASL